MPLAIATNVQADPSAPDDLDNLFNYDDAVEDFLQDLPIGKDQQNNNSAPQEPAKNIDEEITVKKKRKPVPKLDEARLLSQQGIPKLRKITKSRLKFRGKGHECSDISRLLNTYQLWLDDLYPREKFRDALGRVEKLGHSKRMQITRRAWLDATKPHQREASPERIGDTAMSGAVPGAGGEGHSADEDAIFGTSMQREEENSTAQADKEVNDGPEDDELDALLAGNGASVPSRDAMPPQRRTGPFEEDDPDEDELDALLAEQPSREPESAKETHKAIVDPETRDQRSLADEFADDEEAMAGMDDLW